jgi:MYXO-CTERM domain-containing protein
MSWELIALGFDVYAVTFAHPHGDNFQHAELLAKVLALISSRHEGKKVDVVAHSMGGIALRILSSHDGTVRWGDHGDERGAAYASVGTAYEGLVRRVVFLGTPQLGADTSFRWPNGNYTRVIDRPTNSPLSWQAYYPLSTTSPLVFDDFTNFGYFADPPVFPGQTQVLANLRGRHALPGETSALGVMALQQDWLTSYEGGLGFVSRSLGLDEAVARGGRLIDKLETAGMDPSIEIFIAAGLNPILPIEDAQEFLPEEERQQYGSRIRSDWPRLQDEWFDLVMPWHTKWPAAELEKVFDGRSIFGEVSGPSDGLVFSVSVLATDALTSRGARVTEVRAFDELNHLELVYASALASRFFKNPDIAQELYDPVAGAKYEQPENQVVQWIASLFATPNEPGTDAGPGADATWAADSGPPSDSGPIGADAGIGSEPVDGSLADLGSPPPDPDDGSWGCSSTGNPGPSTSFSLLVILALAFRWRRHRHSLEANAALEKR